MVPTYLCFFFSTFATPQENGRSVPDLTASPGRAPPGPMPSSHQQQQQPGQGIMQQRNQYGQLQQGGSGGEQRGMGGPGPGGGGSGSGSNKEPVLLQGDFRKVSGISSEIFRQIEAVENDHDPSTAAALEVSRVELLTLFDDNTTIILTQLEFIHTEKFERKHDEIYAFELNRYNFHCFTLALAWLEGPEGGCPFSPMKTNWYRNPGVFLYL